MFIFRSGFPNFGVVAFSVGQSIQRFTHMHRARLATLFFHNKLSCPAPSRDVAYTGRKPWPGRRCLYVDRRPLRCSYASGAAQYCTTSVVLRLWLPSSRHLAVWHADPNLDDATRKPSAKPKSVPGHNHLGRALLLPFLKTLADFLQSSAMQCMFVYPILTVLF
ncbi:hypothetical protein EI94DRAFT_1722652 [Lactarius quietus]|nr:hypothetical protein EI94DRAFT_1722652 [Lactarius quietus]